MALNATFRKVPSRSASTSACSRSSSGTPRSASSSSTTTSSRDCGARRRSLEEASADLGADTWQTFRFVTFPPLRSALLAGGLLAFALSFDEVIVTTFTAGADETLPIWILNNLSRPNQLPIVNVVAVFVILLSMIPVYFASRLSRESPAARRRRATGVRRPRALDATCLSADDMRLSARLDGFRGDSPSASATSARRRPGARRRRSSPRHFDSTQILPSIRRTSSRQM